MVTATKQCSVVIGIGKFSIVIKNSYNWITIHLCTKAMAKTNKIEFLDMSITWLVEITPLIKYCERITSTPKLFEISPIHDIVKWSRSSAKIKCFYLSELLIE